MKSSFNIQTLHVSSQHTKLRLTIRPNIGYQIYYVEDNDIDCFDISVASIESIINSIKGYETVELTIVSSSIIELKELFKNNSSIKTLELNTKGCEAVDMWWCFENCPNLESLDLSDVNPGTLQNNKDFHIYCENHNKYLMRSNGTYVMNARGHNNISKINFETLPKLKEIRLDGWSKEDVKSFLDNDVKDNQPARSLVENIYNKLLLNEFTSKILIQQRELQDLRIKVETNDQQLEDMKTSLQNEYDKRTQELTKKHDEELESVKTNFQNEMNSMKQEIEEKYNQDLCEMKEQTKQEFINEIETLKAQLEDKKRMLNNLKDSIQEVLKADNE